MTVKVSNTRVTNAQILGSLQDLATLVGGLAERVSVLEGGTVVAQPATGKANTRKNPAKKGSWKGTKATRATKAPVTKTLTRKAWQEVRRTKGGTVRVAFRGLTREQAFEKGLCPGYRLPDGSMRAALSDA